MCPIWHHWLVDKASSAFWLACKIMCRKQGWVPPLLCPLLGDRVCENRVQGFWNAGTGIFRDLGIWVRVFWGMEGVKLKLSLLQRINFRLTHFVSSYIDCLYFVSRSRPITFTDVIWRCPSRVWARLVDHTVLSTRLQTWSLTGGEFSTKDLMSKCNCVSVNSQFWTLGLGLRLVLDFSHLSELNSPKKSLFVPLDRISEYFYTQDRWGVCTEWCLTVRWGPCVSRNLELVSISHHVTQSRPQTWFEGVRAVRDISKLVWSITRSYHVYRRHKWRLLTG